MRVNLRRQFVGGFVSQIAGVADGVGQRGGRFIRFFIQALFGDKAECFQLRQRIRLLAGAVFVKAIRGELYAQPDVAGDIRGGKFGFRQMAGEHQRRFLHFYPVPELAGDGAQVGFFRGCRHAQQGDDVLAVIQQQDFLRLFAAFVFAFGQRFYLIEQGAADDVAGNAVV